MSNTFQIQLNNVVDFDTYFEKHTAPSNLPEEEEKIKAFVNLHASTRRIVLVTSGGTAVPLENQTVRFVDNFSAGTRGAASTEYFLQHNYAVIFLYREHSLQPFNRHLTHSSRSLLDCLTIQNDRVYFDNDHSDFMIDLLKKFQKVESEQTLLMISFFTLNDYLFLLRSATQIMSPLKKNAIYYLAAAVSDFFIPKTRMKEHKIQSGDGGLVVALDQVPKFLKPLVNHWASGGFIVSFKLETDESLLVPKARKAISTYGHEIVIGNLLKTRKQWVLLITIDSEWALKLDDADLAKGVEIESKLIPLLIQRHNEFIERI